LTIMSISAGLRQTRVVLGYIKAFINQLPELKSRVVREIQSGIEFKEGITVESHTASFRSTRGYSLLGVVLDEVAFFRTEEGSANVDTELDTALTPGLARVAGSMKIGISSPWGRHGLLYRNY